MRVDIPGVGLVDFPDTMTEQQVQEAAKKLYTETQQATPSPADMTAGEVAVSAVKSFPSSFKNLIGDIVSAIVNPVETVQSVLDVGAGALQEALPEKFVQAVGEDKRSRDLARQVGQYYADRYGTSEGLKQAIATDPAGVLADLSTVLTAGSAAAPRAIAGPLQTAARTVDPIAATTQLAQRGLGATGRGTAGVLGMQTGTGTEPIQQAFQAGREGGPRAEAFTEAMRGRSDPQDILVAAKQNLEELGRIKQAEYRAGMADVTKDKTVLSFDGIDNAINKSLGQVKFKGQVKQKQAADKLQEVQGIVNNWKNLEPAEYHTPEGLDALKQQVGDVLETIPFESRAARKTVGDVYNSIKTEIANQAPGYAKTMRQYTEASDQIREIEKTLSLGKKASQDTAMRKLMSLMRNNANTNYGERLRLAQQLEQVGGQQMMPSLAGLSLEEFVPRGIQRATAPGTGYLSYLVGGLPAAAASVASSSPRAMGELAYGTGVATRGADVGIQAARRRAPFLLTPELYNLIYQAGQPAQITQE